jgi:hypothetical protein
VDAAAAEFVVAADFTGNGLEDVVVVDRVSGAWRLGAHAPEGTLEWGALYAGGIADPSAVSAAEVLASGRHALVIAGADANRIQVIDPLNPLAAPVVAFPEKSLGPSAVVGGRLGGSGTLEDLVVGSMLNGGSDPYRLLGYENAPAGTFTLVGDPGVSGTEPILAAQRVVLNYVSDEWVGYLVEPSPGNACVRVLSLEQPGMPVRLEVCGLDPAMRFHLVPFGGAAVGTLVTWIPGEDRIWWYTISPTGGGNYAVAGSGMVSVPFALGSVQLVQGDGADVLLALRSFDGYEISVHPFDGSTLGGPLQQHVAPAADQPFSALASLGSGRGWVALQGQDGVAGSGAAAAELYMWSGAVYKPTHSASFGAAAPRAGMSNVSLMSAEPFVNPQARPVMLRNTRDWTSGPAPVLPGPVTVTAEQYLGPAVGLADPQLVALGASPAGAGFALLNQYSAPVSVFTLSRASGVVSGQVGIDPAPGLYDRSIELRFSSLPAGMDIFYRDAGAEWKLYEEPGLQPELDAPGYAAWFGSFVALVRFAETTVEYFGVDGSGQRTPIRRATYRFTEPPDTLSTLGDGVPDYVKLGLGYSPFNAPQGDASSGIGNWKQALLDGSGIDPRWLSGSAVDVYARPLAHDGSGNAAVASRLAQDPPEVLPDGTVYGGNQIFAYDLSGGLIDQGRDPIPSTTDRNEGLGSYPAFAEPSAFVTGLSGGPAAVHVLGTRPGYALPGTLPATPSSITGRQLLGLLPIAFEASADYERTYGGSTLAAEAAAWVAGASVHYAATPPAVQTTTLDAASTIAALVFERWLQAALVSRGSLSGDYAVVVPDANAPISPPADFLTISGFRGREGARPMATHSSGALTPSTAALRQMAQWTPADPAYRLIEAAAAIDTFVRQSGDPGAVALRLVADDIFRISAAHANSHPGALDPPIDVLRQLLLSGAVPEAYQSGFSGLPGAPYSALVTADYAAALDGLATALALPQGRPVISVTVEFRGDSLDDPACLLVNELSLPGNVFSLFNADGRPFRLPASFRVLPGTHMFLRGFTDLSVPSCAGTAVEVIELVDGPAVEVLLVPTANGTDSDGNLLGDEWELAFFGSTGIDPWEDANNDGYTYLQKYLDGKDPFLPASYSAAAAVDLEIPALDIDATAPGEVTVSFTFPQAYIHLLQVAIYEDPTLSGDWSVAPYPLLNPSPGNFEFVVPYDVTEPQFWQVGISLP